MHLLSTALLVGAVVLQGMIGAPAAEGPDAGNGPAAVLAKAWPLYDFSSASMKPWHLKASYLLYDAKGKHPEAGMYEYWWASPDLSRSTWLRAGLRHTDWHLADGQLAYEAKGSPLSLFEYKLEAALLAPLPRARDLDPAHFRLIKEGGSGNGASPGGSCFSIVPPAGTPGAVAAKGSGPDTPKARPADGPFPTYCFDAQPPVLRSMYSFERVLTQFSNVRKTQGRYLAHGITISEGERKLLTATVAQVEPIGLDDPALKPPAGASKTEVFVSGDVSLKDVDVDKDVARGMLLRKTEPVY